MIIHDNKATVRHFFFLMLAYTFYSQAKQVPANLSNMFIKKSWRYLI